MGQLALCWGRLLVWVRRGLLWGPNLGEGSSGDRRVRRRRLVGRVELLVVELVAVVVVVVVALVDYLLVLVLGAEHFDLDCRLVWGFVGGMME